MAGSEVKLRTKTFLKTDRERRKSKNGNVCFISLFQVWGLTFELRATKIDILKKYNLTRFTNRNHHAKLKDGGFRPSCPMFPWKNQCVLLPIHSFIHSSATSSAPQLNNQAIPSRGPESLEILLIHGL